MSRIHSFPKHLLCLAVAVALLMVQSAAAADWQTVKPVTGGFSCEMPGEAKPQTQKVPTPIGEIEVTLYLVELADSAYLVNSTALPANAGDATADMRLDGARDGAVANSKGKLVSEKKITLDGNPGRQILIEQPGNLYTQLRVYMVGNRLIQALVVSMSKETNKDMDRFFASLKLSKS